MHRGFSLHQAFSGTFVKVRPSVIVSSFFIMVKQKRYIRVFQRAGATDEAHSRTLEDLHLRDTPMFRRMIMKGMFVACHDDRFYLNEPVVNIFLMNRQYFLRILFILILILVIAYITGSLLK